MPAKDWEAKPPQKKARPGVGIEFRATHQTETAPRALKDLNRRSSKSRSTLPPTILAVDGLRKSCKKKQKRKPSFA